MTKVVLTCDTVVIGAGTAGLEAFKAASERGVHCILIESGPLGTGTKRTGETPVSSLMSAGKMCHALMELEQYGVKASFDFALDLDNVLNNVRALRAKDTSEVLSFIYRIPENQRLIGKAGFLNSHAVMVNESHIVYFKSAVIATGAVPVIPYELNQFAGAGGVYTTRDLFELDHLPNSMAVFGSNREGLQIGQALSYLGVKVVVFGNDKIWQLTDGTVLDATTDVFKERFDLVLNSYTTAIEKYEHGFGIYYMDASNYENVLGVDTILAANIRYPKLEGLNLRPLGIRLDRLGCIRTNSRTMQSSLPHIFAAGSVSDLECTNATAASQGTIAGANAANYARMLTEALGSSFFKNLAPADLRNSGQFKGDIPDYDSENNLVNFEVEPEMDQELTQRLEKTEPVVPESVPIDILYTDPELAVVGLSYEKARQRAKEGRPFVATEQRINEGRFRITRHEGGMLRLYCDAVSHELLGAEMCMYGADHIAHYLAQAIFRKATVDEIAALPCFSPSYEEIVKQAAAKAVKNIARKVQGLS